MRILIVEDEPDMSGAICSILTDAGHECDAASNGLEALDKYDGQELMLTDWMMPDMNGITLVSKLREKHEFVFVIFITAKSRMDNQIEAIASGGNDFIGKPFDISELLFKVDRAKHYIALNKAKNEEWELDWTD